jgi:hypothetical protein
VEQINLRKRGTDENAERSRHPGRVHGGIFRDTGLRGQPALPVPVRHEAKPILVITEETEKLLRGLLAKQHITKRVDEYFANLVQP